MVRFVRFVRSVVVSYRSPLWPLLYL